MGERNRRQGATPATTVTVSSVTDFDADRDGHNTRHEVVIAQTQVTLTFASTGCTITAGRWVFFYDKQTCALATKVQIDQLIPCWTTRQGPPAIRPGPRPNEMPSLPRSVSRTPTTPSKAR